MTDQTSPAPTTPGTAALDSVARACVHIDAAARQLETAAGGDVFSVLLGPAGQLALIRGGIDPTMRAAADPNDRLGPIAHLDQALSLLDSVPSASRQPDLLVWTLRLAELRDTLPAAWAEQP